MGTLHGLTSLAHILTVPKYRDWMPCWSVPQLSIFFYPERFCDSRTHAVSIDVTWPPLLKFGTHIAKESYESPRYSHIRRISWTLRNASRKVFARRKICCRSMQSWEMHTLRTWSLSEPSLSCLLKLGRWYRISSCCRRSKVNSSIHPLPKERRTCWRIFDFFLRARVSYRRPLWPA